MASTTLLAASGGAVSSPPTRTVPYAVVYATTTRRNLAPLAHNKGSSHDLPGAVKFVLQAMTVMLSTAFHVSMVAFIIALLSLRKLWTVTHLIAGVSPVPRTILVASLPVISVAAYTWVDHLDLSRL